MTAKPSKRRKRKFPGGTLFIISVLMFGSATIRLGLEAGPALAREISHQGATESQASDQHSQTVPSSDELANLIAVLQVREQAVQQREGQIEDRLKALEIVEQAIDTRLSALKVAEQELTATLALADVAAEDDLARLTSVYEKMKPKQSAALFEEMDPEFAAGFLARMRPESAANVMAAITPMAAYAISVVLAGRNAEVPKD